MDEEGLFIGVEIIYIVIVLKLYKLVRITVRKI